MPADVAQLVSASNYAREALGREPELDENAAIAVLVENGLRLHLALTGVAEDEDFWARLRKESLNCVLNGTEHSDEFSILFEAQHKAVLEVLGYQPPPPVTEVVDDAVEALHLLAALSHEPSARLEQADQAREALRVFNARLGALLEERGVMPHAVRRSLLRRCLRRGASIALAIAPVALAWSAKLGADALGLPGDMIKDVAQTLAGLVATMIVSALPEAVVSELEAGALLGEIDGRARVRALASVAESRLLRLDLQHGLDEVGLRTALAAVEHTYSAVSLRLHKTDQYQTDRAIFRETLQALVEQADERTLTGAVEAWRDLQATLERMEPYMSSFEPGMRESMRERARGHAIDTAREAARGNAPEGEQSGSEEEEQQRTAAAAAAAASAAAQTQAAARIMGQG